MAAGCIKVTMIKPHRRSRGRMATCTRTVLRRLRHDVERADLLAVLSEIVPMLDGTPIRCRFGGESYEIERFECRRESGVRIVRAHFVGEREIFRERARRVRRARRAQRHARESALRAERRARTARCADIVRARRARTSAHAPMFAAAYPSPIAPAAPYGRFTIFPRARGRPDKNIQNLGT